MKPERSIIAARPLARHCAEIFAMEPPQPDPDSALDLLADRMAAPLAARLTGLCAGFAASVVKTSLRRCRLDELSLNDAGESVFSQIGLGASTAPILLALDVRAVFSLLDRAFGGSGTAPDPLPERFLMSADLFASRLEAAITDSLALALESEATAPASSLQRTRNAGELRGIASDTMLHTVTFEVRERERQPWSITLAIPADTLASLTAEQACRPADRQSNRPPARPDAEPFGDVPLTLRARLVDMHIGFARLCDLKPGDILPVAVARNVPIRLRDTVIATGTIGELDDRVAIQITQAF